MFVQLNDAHEQVCKWRRLYVMQDSLHDVGLRLYERQHLSRTLRSHRAGRVQEMNVFTSAGFLLRNATLTFAKCEAIMTWLRISSGDLSRTVSQKGRSSWSG